MLRRGSELKSRTDWRVYSKSGERPSDIPSAPERTYKRSGWKGYGDWLGTGTIQTSQRQYKEFTEARAYVRSLGLKSQNEWELYKKSRKLPKDIPLVPRNTYKKSGWISMGDWLGTEKPD